jgi:hypothetical protein
LSSFGFGAPGIATIQRVITESFLTISISVGTSVSHLTSPRSASKGGTDNTRTISSTPRIEGDGAAAAVSEG